MKQEEKIRNENGWISLHTDFINNDELQGYRVTFVNGQDDPNNDPILVVKRREEEENILRTKELTVKLNDDTITNIEIREFLKLKFIKGV